jgi:hypothetical protein
MKNSYTYFKSCKSKLTVGKQVNLLKS